jgi:hypothetical protein
MAEYRFTTNYSYRGDDPKDDTSLPDEIGG